MKTKLMCLMALLPYLLFSQTNDFRFAHNFPGEDQVKIYEVETLNNGDYVILGTFRENVTIGDTVLNIQSYENYYESFLACFNPEHQLKWLNHIPCAAHEYNFIEKDAQDNVYLGCIFLFDPLYLSDTTLVPMSNSDFLIMKFGADGERTWLEHFRSNRSARIQAMQVDDAGNIYFSASVSTSLNAPACFLYLNDTVIYDDWSYRVYGKIDTAGSTEYIHKLAFPQISGSEAHSCLHLTSENKLYYFESRNFGFVYGSDTVEMDQPFLIKIDEKGEYQWVKAMPEIRYPLYGNMIFSDQNNELYLSGNVQDTAVIGTDTIIASGQDNGLLVYKIDTAGNLLWHQEFEKESLNRAVMAFDPDNNLYLSYCYRGEVTIGDTTLANYATQVLCTKINPDGLNEWVLSSYGNCTAELSDIAIDRNNDLWIAGRYSNSIHFADTVLTGASAMYKGYLVKVNTCQRMFSVGQDTVIKLSDTLLLRADAGYESYLWNTGSNEEEIHIIANDLGTGVHSFDLTVSDEYCVYSDTIEIQVIDDAAVDEISAGTFSIAPNPATNYIHLISAENIQPELIKIFSGDGILRLQEKNTTDVDISSLKAGYYIVLVKSDEKYYYQKFIKTQNP